ncbi:MAG: formate dehydrogenase accessory protein FdhE [Caldilineae bacterium]|nr:MAG: formate dehydrogenase accessory protein FdhE [Caldilineae bacterium]
MDADIRYYLQVMPGYRDALCILQAIFDMQAMVARAVAPQLHISPDTARARWQRGQPLFAAESPVFPPSLFDAALRELCGRLPAGSPLCRVANALRARDALPPQQVRALPARLLADRRACLRQLATVASVPEEAVAFVLCAILSPLLAQEAAACHPWLEGVGWRRGVCPMCGVEPWMARLLRDDGRRMLACPLCRTEWPFDRLRCPFCDGNTHPCLRYFTVEGDEAHRVACCDHCRRYLKTVDERLLGRRANLPVEDVITSRLDVIAQEQGYY